MDDRDYVVAKCHLNGKFFRKMLWVSKNMPNFALE